MGTVAKNTGLLYVRSVIVLLLALYTSRLLLDALGVDDYGLYSLVGGVVGLFGSLKGMFAFAVQRFLSYAKGENNFEKEKDVFCVSFLLHLIIALLFAFFVGIFGTWFISDKLNIPDGSLPDAYFVFYCSVLTAVVSILLTPFSASVIANEKMGTFAWISVLDAVLKLMVVLLIPYIIVKPVRIYALLILSVEALNFLLYFISCRKFPECRLEKRYNRKLFKEISSFAGWDFLGNTAWAIINEGVNMIINIFGGVAINAARGIAYQVKHAVITMSTNVTVASRPFIIKQAAGGDIHQTYRSVCLMARAYFLITLFTVIPLVVYAKEILDIWLIETPEYAVSFVQLCLLWSVVRTMNMPIDIAFTAFGKMKKYQIFNSITLLLNLPLAYLFLYMGLSYNFAMLTFVIVEIIDILVNMIVAKREIEFDISLYIKSVILRNIGNILVVAFLGGLFYKFLIIKNSYETIFFILLLEIISAGLIVLLLSKEEKNYIYPMVKKLFKKNS